MCNRTAIDVDSIPEHEVLVAGFPCQSFSRANTTNQIGLDDSRGENTNIAT